MAVTVNKAAIIAIALAMRVPAPLKARGKQRSPGRAGHAIVPQQPSGNVVGSTQWRCRATLAAERPGAAVHATREAAGATSAGSQPSPFAPARPRRWCDAGPPKADQKAGAPGRRERRRTPHLQARPTISRIRDLNRHDSEGGASPTLRRPGRTRRPVLREAKIAPALCGCADVEILPSLSAGVCRVTVPFLKGLAAGHECPAYSSE